MKRLVTIGVVVIGLLLSGCGGDDEETPTTPAVPDGVEAPSVGAMPPTTPDESGFPPEFLECMADQGFDIPVTGPPPPALLADPGAQAAFQACAQTIPGGLGGLH